MVGTVTVRAEVSFPALSKEEGRRKGRRHVDPRSTPRSRLRAGVPLSAEKLGLHDS